jgi:O-antigen/teichoic acid export membrane protein
VIRSALKIARRKVSNKLAGGTRVSLQAPIVHGAVVSVVVRVTGLTLSYAANILISRSIGLHGFGRYVIALGWVLVLVFPARLGFDTSSLRYVTLYRENAQVRHLRGFILTAVGTVSVASVAFAVAMVAVGIVAQDSERFLLIWAAALILPLALLGLFSAMMRTAGRIFVSQFYDQVLRPVLIIAGLLFAVATIGQISAENAMLVTTLAAYGALICLFFEFRHIFADARGVRPDLSASHDWFVVSIPILVIGAIQELMNQLEVILLGTLADARQAGLFAACWRLASLMPFALAALATVSGPMIASAYHRGARTELHDISKLVARLGVGFALAVALVLVSAGHWLLGLFGPEFPAAYPILLVLLIGAVVNAYTGVVAYLLTLTGRERAALKIFGFALLVSAALNLILIPPFGALGAAVASASALSTWNIAMLIYVRRTIGIDASALALPPKPL